MYDADNSGKIGLADFEIVVKKIAEVRGWKQKSSKINVLLEKFAYYWIHIRGESDKNRDNKVSLDEWLKYYESILNDPKRYQVEIGSLVNLIFEAFDADGDGTINGNEWIDFLFTIIIAFMLRELFPRLTSTKMDLFLKKNF